MLLVLLCQQVILVAQQYAEVFHRIQSLPDKVRLRYRYTGYLKSSTTDLDGGICLYVSAYSKDSIRIYQKFNTDSSGQFSLITETKWTKFIIEDTLPTNSTYVRIGIYTLYNGNFQADDLTMEIETAENTWQKLYQTSFENGKENWIKGMSLGKDKNPFFQWQISQQQSHSGKQNLTINSKGVIHFGANEKAGKYADVNGIKLYYERYGKGHPLLVLHGNGGSINNAEDHYPDLMKSYEVIAIDSRGQGKSTDSDAPLTYEQMASDINE
ncbi:MAG: alpha/beta hydrolase, partial [Sediminibacterium sp.]|nr:alpha/beta hydrolase [Sediminibacterium sp.]